MSTGSTLAQGLLARAVRAVAGGSWVWMRGCVHHELQLVWEFGWRAVLGCAAMSWEMTLWWSQQQYFGHLMHLLKFRYLL